MSKNEKIDFVIMWVNGDDPEWKKEKAIYSGETLTSFSKIAASDKCFRDWNLLRYWFRGVEKYAPWVNKIHFVTWGHIPPWLNVNNPKINVVNHKDFIDEKYLPLFNAQAIEINVHRIEGIADQFVLFNDDQYLINYVKPTDFFKNGLPCDSAIMSPIRPNRDGTGCAQINDMEIVNDHFNGFQAVMDNKEKWFTYHYGKSLIKTLLVLPWRTMFGYFEPHLPASYLKSTFEEVWAKEKKELEQTMGSRFKNKCDVNQWIMRYWQLSSGKFVPRSPAIGKFYDTFTQLQLICSTIEKQTKRMICINDNNLIINLNAVQAEIDNAFVKILPDKSSYEI